MTTPNEKEKPRPTRREFLKSSTAVVGGVVAAGLGTIPAVHAAGSDEIRVGLIGCGGRGTGAAEDVVTAAPGVKLVAMGDAFKDKIESSLAALKKVPADKINVPEERRFVGLDAYEKVIASDVNYIILATPPGFRPYHFQYAIQKGKHVFFEKPVGVDPFEGRGDVLGSSAEAIAQLDAVLERQWTKMDVQRSMASRPVQQG